LLLCVSDRNTIPFLASVVPTLKLTVRKYRSKVGLFLPLLYHLNAQRNIKNVSNSLFLSKLTALLYLPVYTVKLTRESTLSLKRVLPDITSVFDAVVNIMSKVLLLGTSLLSFESKPVYVRSGKLLLLNCFVSTNKNNFFRTVYRLYSLKVLRL
jgi:hypothetical protein